MPEEEPTLDIILAQLGQYGKYQTLLIILFSMAGFIHAGNRFSFVFSAKNLAYRCEIPECDDSTSGFNSSWLHNAVPFSEGLPEKCKKYLYVNETNTCDSVNFNQSVTEECNSFLYKTKEKTILNEFDNIHCNENLWKLTLVGTMNSAGQFVGLPISGYLADKYGRKTILIWGMILCGIAGIVKAFATSYIFFIVFEFVDSMLAAGAFGCAYILGVELVGPNNRVLAGSILCSFYAAGTVFTGGLAWAFQSWRSYVLTAYALNLLLGVYLFITPESVRWLLTKNKTKEAKQILKKMAKVNGKTISEDKLDLLCSAHTETTAGSAQSPLKELMKSSTLIFRFIVNCYCWLTSSFIFYGLILGSVSLSSNGYLDFILIGLVDIPGYLSTWLFVDRIGRRRFLHISFLFSAAACAAIIFIPPEMYWVKLTVYLFGKFWATAAFSTCYVVSSELFPTHLRNFLLSANSMFARLAAILAPQMPLLEQVWKPFPSTLFSAMAVVAALLSLTFPETSNINLPDSIREAENVEKKVNKTESQET